MALLISPWLIVAIARWLQRRKVVDNLTLLIPGVIPIYVWSIIVLGFATKLSYLEEKHWVANDALGAPTELFPSRFEEITFQVLKKESEDLLGPRFDIVDSESDD